MLHTKIVHGRWVTSVTEKDGGKNPLRFDFLGVFGKFFSPSVSDYSKIGTRNSSQHIHKYTHLLPAHGIRTSTMGAPRVGKSQGEVRGS